MDSAARTELVRLRLALLELAEWSAARLIEESDGRDVAQHMHDAVVSLLIRHPVPRSPF